MKPGQKVICIKRGPWTDCETNEVAPGPIFKEVLIIETISSQSYFSTALEFKPYFGYYDSTKFRPLINHKASVKHLNVNIISTPEVLESRELQPLQNV